MLLWKKVFCRELKPGKVLCPCASQFVAKRLAFWIKSGTLFPQGDLMSIVEVTGVRCIASVRVLAPNSNMLTLKASGIAL